MTPRLYQVSNVLLYDVPGFKDADKNKNIVIKSYLSITFTTVDTVKLAMVFCCSLEQLRYA